MFNKASQDLLPFFVVPLCIYLIRSEVTQRLLLDSFRTCISRRACNEQSTSYPPVNHQKQCPGVLQLPKQVSLWLVEIAKPAFARGGLTSGAIGQAGLSPADQLLQKGGGVEVVGRRKSSSGDVMCVRRWQALRGQCSHWQLFQVPGNPCTHWSVFVLWRSCKYFQALANSWAGSFG